MNSAALAKANATPTGCPAKLDVRQQVDAGDRGGDRGEVAGRAHADESQRDRADEFDRRHRRKRQMVDRDVEGTRSSARRRARATRPGATRPGRASPAFARDVARARRPPPPTRCEATQPRARRPVRRAGRRTTGRGSGRPRCRRSRRAGAASRRRRGAAAGRQTGSRAHGRSENCCAVGLETAMGNRRHSLVFAD